MPPDARPGYLEKHCVDSNQRRMLEQLIAAETALTSVDSVSTIAPDELPEGLLGHEKYSIIRKLGSGGMGEVYLAEHRVMGRLVAIKVIRNALLRQPNVSMRFNREIRLAANLDHPNIAKALDAEVTADVQIFSMEFVEGESLQQYVLRKESIPVTEACSYILHAALGLQHAFEKGLVHRDLKPQNLMRTPDGGIKILDFGLAKFQDWSLENGLTAANQAMGTPQYMSPEQWQDSRSVDIRADIYSLGCSLYFLLCGHPPFVRHTAYEYMVAHVNVAPERVSTKRPDVTPEVASLLMRMLAKDPKRRPQTPEAVFSELAELIDRPEYKRMPNRASHNRMIATSKWTQRKSIIRWLAVSVAFGLACVAIFLSRPTHSPSTKGNSNVASEVQESTSLGPNPRLYSEDPDRALAEWILKMGGRVKVNSAEPWLLSVDELKKEPFSLSHVDFGKGSGLIGDKELDYLVEADIVDVSLQGSKITDIGLEKISNLPLLLLNAEDVRGITDDGARHIARMRGVQWLYLSGTCITDKGLRYFEQLENLQELQLERTQVSALGMHQLQAVYQQRKQHCLLER